LLEATENFEKAKRLFAGVLKGTEKYTLKKSIEKGGKNLGQTAYLD
jgi:hypothetical protein